MEHIPHPDRETISLSCGVITVSDTRTRESDRSGKLIQSLLQKTGHQVTYYTLIKDEPQLIQAQLQQWCSSGEIQAVIINGGTGIAQRDTTYDALASLLEKTLPGFGELFRFLSYQDISSTRQFSGLHKFLGQEKR